MTYKKGRKNSDDKYKKYTAKHGWTIVSKAESGEGVDAPEDERLETSHIGGKPQSATLKWKGNGYNYTKTWIRFDLSALVDCEA